MQAAFVLVLLAKLILMSMSTWIMALNLCYCRVETLPCLLACHMCSVLLVVPVSEGLIISSTKSGSNRHCLLQITASNTVRWSHAA